MQLSVHSDCIYLIDESGEYSREYRMEEAELREYVDLLEDDRFQRAVDEGMSKLSQEELKQIGRHLLQDYPEPMALCPRHGHLITRDEWGKDPNQVVYGVCKQGGNECPSCGAVNSISKTSTSRDARKGDKYECDECGYTAEGMPTG